MSKENPYDVLGVVPEAEEEVIDAVYNSLVKKHHPDHGGDEETFKQIKNAYERIQSGDSSSNFSDANEDIDSILSLFNTPIDTNVATGRLCDGLVLEGEQLTIAITNIIRTDISDYIPENWVHDVKREDRLVILTHVSNHSDYVQSFKPYDIRLITKDGRRYDIDNLTGIGHAEVDFHGDTKSLPSHLYNERRDMEPHTTGNFISVVEEIPNSVEIDRIIYPFKLFDGHNTDGVVKSKTRYVYDIKPHHWEEFDLVAGGKLESESDSDVKMLNEATPNDSKLKKEGDNKASKSQSHTDNSKNDALGERDTKRIADIIELEPTKNSELQDCWDMDSGSEVHRYLESTLSHFYKRNDDKKIVATKEAKEFISEVS